MNVPWHSFSQFFCAMAQKGDMTIEILMENLRRKIGEELSKKSYTMSAFSEKCGISEECLHGILYRRTRSADCETIIKICENSEISYADLFDISENEIFKKMLKNFCFTDGENEYSLVKS